MSFSDASVRNTLDSKFVSTYTNTTGNANTGHSFSHSPDQPPGPCGRGAGRQNVQSMFLTPSGKIFHIATGFLSPEDLLSEIRFASDLYDAMKLRKSNPDQVLVSLQTDRMESLGFSRSEICSPNPFQEIKTGFSPSDLGIGMGSNPFFGDIGKNRILRDTQFVLKNPLMSVADFEKDTSGLVGRHKSFFGSNAMMGGLQNINNMKSQTNRSQMLGL